MEDGDDATQTEYLCVDLKLDSQFIGRSVEDGLPVCIPLNTLKELLSWIANDPEDHGQFFSIATELHNPKIKPEGAPRTLVCHDMKGGYLSDRFVQQTKQSDCFHLDYWNMVDIFVYFSHHFITIPPVGWINACHRNGVTILGTFITEFEEGFESCKIIFSKERTWKKVADQMTKLATFFHFDGWLINIENVIETDNVTSVVGFVRYLTEKMHAVDKNMMVLWYDSITAEGKLKWQNELNSKNRCFYDVCDGIFLNYCWKSKNLESSLQSCSNGSTVYVGVDVFGRGCFGGGGFNSSMALQLIRKFGLSVALFAPGWLYEQLDPHDFPKNSERFWKALQPYCESYPLRANAGCASRFNTGSTLSHQHINAQDTMPLIPSDHMRIDINDGDLPGSLVINASQFDDRLVDLFKITMFCKDGAASLICPASCECQFVLRTDHGLIPSSSEGIQFPNNKVLYFLQDGPFKVIALSVKGRTGSSLSLIELLPGLINETDYCMKSLSMKCEQIDWKAAEQPDQFSFSVTLFFDQLPACVASTQITCVLSAGNELERRALGNSFCHKFRIAGLIVPNPQFHGPGCNLLFVAIHLTRGGVAVAESRLRIIYAENI